MEDNDNDKELTDDDEYSSEEDEQDTQWGKRGVGCLTRKRGKKVDNKIMSENFRKTYNINCIMSKNQRLEGKH